MNSAQIKLYIHIGSPKTGSSAIQKFLNTHRKRLAAEQSILYPNFDIENLDEGNLMNHASFFHKANENKNHQYCFAKFNEAVEFCKANNIEKIIISNESWEKDWWPELMHKMIQNTGVDYTFIVYIRRQDKFLEAAWKEWGHRWQACKNIMEYKTKIKLDWEKILNGWTAFFPPDRFIVRPYEKTVIGDNVVVDFCRLIDLKDMDLYNPSSDSMLNSNPGFNWEIMKILGYSRKILKNREDKRLLLFMDEMLPETYKKKPMQEYDFLSPEERLEIIREFEESNRSIARRFLGRKEGDLFSDPLPVIGEKWESHENLTIEKLVPVLMEILLKQQEQIKHLQYQIRQLNVSRNPD